jgi:hypothetical protein
MNNLVSIAQVTGTVAIFLLFCIKFYIAISPKSTNRLLRIAILWTTVYIFFLFTLRLLSLFNIGTIDQLRIISGFAALIPLIAIIVHVWLSRKIIKTLE